jgi:hypothetical protein
VWQLAANTLAALTRHALVQQKKVEGNWDPSWLTGSKIGVVEVWVA